MSFAAVLERLAKLANPYPGLRPFDTNEAHLFFGRDQQVLDLTDRLNHNRFVAVLGLSGSGKSSLVQAGLIPALHRGHLLETGRRWRVAIARPSGAPFAKLAASLHCNEAGLRASSHGLIEYARGQLLEREAMLVVIDQFEELFRYKDAANRSTDDAVAASKAAEFVSLLLASARSPLPIYVVITMRTDFLGDCAEFPEFPEVLNESQYLVPRLTREQRRQAIEGPLGRARISSVLMERILNDAGDEPDQLPILQHALMRTWARWRASSPDDSRPIETEDYEKTGGFKGALDQHANELLEAPAVIVEPKLVEITFKRLTALGRGNRERRDPARLEELWDLCNAVSDEKRQRVNAIIDLFRQGEATFLAPREGALKPDTYIDIAHESLIRNWEILAKWWLPEEEKQAKTLIELLDRARGRQARKRELLNGLDLSDALEWNTHRNRSARWAEHYVGAGGIDEVDAFLSASHQKFEEDERKALEHFEHEISIEKRLREAAEGKAQAEIAAARRTRFFSCVLAVLLLGALALAFVAWGATLRAREQQKLAESRVLAAKAETLVSQGKGGEALATAIQAFSIEKTSQAREAIAHAFPQELEALAGHADWVNSASFSPDGERVATASYDQTARVWNAATGQVVAKLVGHSGDVYSVAFSPDGQRVVTASADKAARVWYATTGQVIAKLVGHSDDVNRVAFSPDGQLVATASFDRTARVWNAVNGQLIAKLAGHSGDVNSVAFSPDGQLVVTASFDGTARVWNAVNGQLIAKLEGHSGNVNGAVFSRDGKKVVTASADHTARVWNAATGEVNMKLEGHSGAVNSAGFSPDGQQVVTASDDNTARVWNAVNGQVIAELEGHSGNVNSAVFSRDGKRVVTASNDGTARVWNTATTGEVIAKLEGHSGSVGSAAFSPDGRRLVTASVDNTARVWNAATGQVIVRLTGHSDAVNSAEFSPDGQRVVTASNDNTARVWNAASGQLIAKLAGHSGFVYSAEFSADGRSVVTASQDKTARVWNAATGDVIGRLAGHSGQVLSAAFSPDGQRVVTASEDRTARVWNAATGELITKLEGHSGDVNSVAFSPDGERVVTASEDRTARVWNAATGELIGKLEGHSGQVISVALSSDGQRAVTASDDKTARVWNAATGEVIGKLEGHSGTVYSAAFSSDGQRVVTASADGTALIFRIVTLNEIVRLLDSK